jgi:hypothetical protein
MAYQLHVFRTVFYLLGVYVVLITKPESDFDSSFKFAEQKLALESLVIRSMALEAGVRKNWTDIAAESRVFRLGDDRQAEKE